MNQKTSVLFTLLLIIAPMILTTGIVTEGFSNTNPENEITTDLLGFGDYAPDWSLKEVSSDVTKSMASYRGKVVLLEFFATWCDPCTNQFLPYLKDVRAYYSSSQLVMLSVNTDPTNENETVVEHYVDLYDISWSVFRDTDTTTVSDAYDVRTIPTFYIIDKNQIVSYSHTGVVSDAFLIDKIDDLIPAERNPNEWWANNWWWFAAGILVVGIVSAMIIQRRRVVLHNRKVDEQILEARRRKRRARER